ncbi:hypothetical protein [Arsenicicoccus sp. oral taxon 190]|uniref:hypothetical protein n=1 Tax=Arsenicicoccus sp. oral taxon 190 TaxID=1658671 RepID=UPI00067A10E6|nr:hypothetical protein [Arsenicicoccus sp. oral taxon 190]AKT50753.1 hypothetical protein ADJ73_04520 [Arsenicicoccus sp. oral taxon 190]
MPRTPRALAPGGLLFAGTFAGALLGYAFFVVLGRVLSADDLGAVGSLINLSTILSVPGLGLQLVTARGVAAGRGREVSQGREVKKGREVGQDRTGGPGRAADPGLLAAAVLVGGVPGLLLVAAAPLLAPLLHLPGPGALVVLAVSAVPMTVAFAGLGVLQGAELFASLGLAALVTGVAKVAAAVLAAALGQGVLGVMGWYTAGWFAVAALVVLLVLRGAGRGHVEAGGGVWAAGWARARAGLAGALPTAGLLVLANLDLILARHFLGRAESGVYTMGSLFAKVAFWGPQFVATMYFPRMARPEERAAALRSALALTAGVGAVGVLVAALAGRLLVAVVAGSGYVAELGPLAWVFTAVGVVLALVQVLVYADLAVAGHRVGAVVWVGAAAVALAVGVWHTGVAVVVSVVLGTLLLLVVAAAGLTRRGVSG